MAKIAVVEDDVDMMRLVTALVEGEGHTVLAARDGDSALRVIRDEVPDLVILDINLPGLDGIEVLKRVRQFSHMPVIMLTGRDTEMDMIIGLEAGADDYVTKPFKPGEFRSRLRAHLRRAVVWSDRAQKRLQVERGGLVLDPERFECTLEGARLELTRVEFDLLYCLASSPGIVFTRDRLMELVWGDDEYIDPRGIDVHISRVRHKIEQDPARPEKILTVHGRGYKFNPAV